VLYLAMPFDLVTEFLPVAGQLDELVVLALLLRGGCVRPGRGSSASTGRDRSAP